MIKIRIRTLRIRNRIRRIGSNEIPCEEIPWLLCAKTQKKTTTVNDGDNHGMNMHERRVVVSKEPSDSHQL
jgi:hypothetical protein